MGIPQYFSASYAEARRKFLEAARAGGAAIESHVNPNAQGMNGEELATDVACFGDLDAENLFITCAGTHGNEGFCGSGCQVGLIKEDIINARPQSVAVLLVHAINPYGFSHLRRVTEDNVDLNRNFQDFAKPLPENPRYSEIHDLLVPSDWDGPGRAKAEAGLQAWRDDNGGMSAFQAVVAGGQYKFPDGMFFGGQRATWSSQTFRAIVKKHGAAAKRVGLIDVHSGLGPTGYGEPISIVAPDTPSFERARAWWGREVTSLTDGTSKSPPVTGPLIGSIEQSLPGAEVTSIGLEYGTVELFAVLDALRGDNWLYARGLKSGLSMDSALARDIKTKVRDALYVDTDDWKEKVYARAADFTLKAYRGLTS
ncbi:MAG: M14 family metallopeptidase [Xanthobacteraceae bacterium]